MGDDVDGARTVSTGGRIMNPIEKSIARSEKAKAEIDKLVSPTPVAQIGTPKVGEFADGTKFLLTQVSVPWFRKFTLDHKDTAVGYLSDDGYINAKVDGRAFIAMRDMSLVWEVSPA